MDEIVVKKAAACYDCDTVKTLNLERLCLQAVPNLRFCSTLCELFLTRNEIREINGLDCLCGISRIPRFETIFLFSTLFSNFCFFPKSGQMC